MSTTYFLLIIAPIVAFVIVDAFAGLRAGVVSAIVLAFLAAGVDVYLTRQFEVSTLVEPLLITVMGAVTLRFKNPRYLKFQPVISNVVVVVLLAYYQIAGTPFLQKCFSLMAPALPPWTRELVDSPIFLERMGAMSLHLIFLMILNGAMVAWAALRLSNWWWLAMRLAVYPMMFALMIIDLLPVFRSVAPGGLNF